LHIIQVPGSWTFLLSQTTAPGNSVSMRDTRIQPDELWPSAFDRSNAGGFSLELARHLAAKVGDRQNRGGVYGFED
jgi:hypothetical protein